MVMHASVAFMHGLARKACTEAEAPTNIIPTGAVKRMHVAAQTPLKLKQTAAKLPSSYALLVEMYGTLLLHVHHSPIYTTHPLGPRILLSTCSDL